MKANSFLLSWLLIYGSLAGIAQQPAQFGSRSDEVMIAAVSRDSSVLSGGIGSGRILPPRTVVVEPLAGLTASGEWRGIPCHPYGKDGCRSFERNYLSKHHTYTIVSADGRGVIVKSAPVQLSECSVYTGDGTYSGGSIRSTAIAASSAEIFTTGPSARRLTGKEAEPIQIAMSKLVHTKLESTEHLQFYSVRLGGQEFFIVQRAFQDFASKLGYEDSGWRLIFGIGVMQDGKFHFLRWKDAEDENELVLGTIHLKNGMDFLVTTVSDPESQFFRVYGINKGKLDLVYVGGGSSC